MAAVTMFCSCAADNSYTVTGRFNKFDSDSVWLMDQELKVLASIPSRDGSYTFTGKIESPGMAIVASDRNAENVGCFFILEPGKLTVSAVLDSFYVANGTKANDLFSEFMTRRYKITIKARETGGMVTDELMAMIEESEKKLKDDLMDNLDNFYGLYCLEVLADRDDPESTRIILDKFSKSIQKTDKWKELSAGVDKLMSFGVGKPYLDFTQSDPQGNPITASKVMADPKNRYVLIDFWASWCGPCMGELPYLRDAYAKYSGKGFQILGVSLDRDRESWLKAIEDEKMTWLHVSDLNYWSNEVAQLYNINSIPSNFLVDCKTGIIVNINLRGPALDRILADLLK